MLVSRTRPDVQITVHSCSVCDVMLFRTDKHNFDAIAKSVVDSSYQGNIGSIPPGCESTGHFAYDERVFDIADNLTKYYDPMHYMFLLGELGRKCTLDGTLIEESEEEQC
jgi:hypothetical protein